MARFWEGTGLLHQMRHLAEPDANVAVGTGCLGLGIEGLGFGV